MTDDREHLDAFFGRARVTTLERPAAPRTAGRPSESAAPRRTAGPARTGGGERPTRRTATPSRRSSAPGAAVAERTAAPTARAAAARVAAPTARTTSVRRSAIAGRGPAPSGRRADRSAPVVGPDARPPRGRRPLRSAPGAADRLADRRRTRRRLWVFVVGVLVICAGIAAKLAYVQVVQRDSLMAYGASGRDTSRVLPAVRGAIYDRSGRAFALSVAEPAVVADPTVIAEPAVAAAALAPVLHLDEADLRSTLARSDTRYVVLAPTADQATQAAVRDLNLKGVSFEDRYVRETPTGDLARGVVGSTYGDGATDDKGRQGRTGFELAFDRQLAGQPGRLSYERAPNGDTIAGAPEHLEPAVPGTDVYLTLDQALQYATEQALGAQVQATGAVQGMAIISRPSTGEVLAMASIARGEDGTVGPTGDDRPVSTQFEPGSVNKMITVAGALEEGLIAPDTPIEVPDHLQVGDHAFTDHDPHPTSVWSPTDILVTSSNVGTIKIAQLLGAERVDRYLRAFGFGAETPGFPGAIDGQLLPLADWSGTSIGAIPIGQGISVTALQMLAAYNVIANDGVYVAPKLVGATDDGTGRKATATSAQRRVISAATAQQVRSILAKVVSDGTGQPAQVPGYISFGKTGTARIPQFGGDTKDAYKDADGRYHYESSFVGGVDGADLSIIVTIQDAKTSIYGSDVAAPVFAQLASLTLRHEQVPPPSLTTAAVDVPELSASARDVEGEDPGLVTETTQG